MLTNKRYIKICGIYLVISFLACVLVAYRAILFGESAYAFLVWNLFLAWIPFALAGLMNFLYLRYRGALGFLLTIPVCIFWLLFFPNALNMLTLYSGTVFSISSGVSLKEWYDFIMFSLIILEGFLLGFVSLRIVQNIVHKVLNTFWSWVFVVFVCFTSGYAIYLGRFIRLNSWDIWKAPWHFFKAVWASGNSDTFGFVLMFAAFLFFIYWGFITAANIGKENSR